jgi:S1-C subfamily serine protease
VPRDLARALDLFHQAAMGGHPSAIVNLAHALDQGVGAPRDPLGAYLWYAIAARRSSTPDGREKALESCDRLSAEIAPTELAAARQVAAQWTPGSEDPRIGLAEASRPPMTMGSGFVVNRTSDVVTNRHAVNGCRKIEVLNNGKPLPATLVAVDRTADLAVLRIPSHLADMAAFRSGSPVRPDEAAAVIGYPLQGVLSSQPSIATGIVSAMAGPHDDRQLMQISAPVQPGDSGGPLVDQSGAVIGVVVGKLEALPTAALAVERPENVNFAVNADLVRKMLDRNGIQYDTASANRMVPTPDIAERSFKFTVIVHCIK